MTRAPFQKAGLILKTLMNDFFSYCPMSANKVVYTTASVMYEWAGAVMEVKAPYD